MKCPHCGKDVPMDAESKKEDAGEPGEEELKVEVSAPTPETLRDTLKALIMPK